MHAQTPAPCDEVVTADWVVTVDGDQRVLSPGAVAIEGDTLVDVGTADEVLARRSPQVVTRLDGHVLIPGMVNAHTHLAMTMFRGVADDIDLAGFLARVLPAEATVLDAERVGVATRAAAVESLCAGVTSALDMYFFCDAALAAGDQVGLRIMTGPVVLDGPGPDGLGPDDRMDWAARWLAEHPARRGWRPVLAPHSTYLVGPDNLARTRDLAGAHGATVHLHAAETLDELADVRSRHGAAPVELLDRLGMLDEHTVLAHGVHLGPADIALVAERGASVAHCPASNLKLAAGVAPVPDLLAAGATVALGTDGPASSNDLDLLGAARLAALVHKGVSGDPTVVDAPTVLAMATIGGARALGVDDALGSLEVGKLADVVAVDLGTVHTRPVFDPVSSLVYAAGRGDVREVWVGGRRVVRDGRATGADPAQVADELDGLGPVVRDVLGR